MLNDTTTTLRNIFFEYTQNRNLNDQITEKEDDQVVRPSKPTISIRISIKLHTNTVMSNNE